MSLAKGKMYTVRHSMLAWDSNSKGHVLPAGKCVVVIDIKDCLWGYVLDLLAHDGTIVNTSISHENAEYWFRKV